MTRRRALPRYANLRDGGNLPRQTSPWPILGLILGAGCAVPAFCMWGPL